MADEGLVKCVDIKAETNMKVARKYAEGRGGKSHIYRANASKAVAI